MISFMHDACELRAACGSRVSRSLSTYTHDVVVVYSGRGRSLDAEQRNMVHATDPSKPEQKSEIDAARQWLRTRAQGLARSQIIQPHTDRACAYMMCALYTR